MYRSTLFTSVLLFLLPLTVSAQNDKVDEHIQAQMQKRNIPGLALLVLKEGKVIKQKAYGLANIELNVPVKTDTAFQIASITKTFTSTAIMALVEEGKLSLDDKVIKLLPGLPSSWSEVTVRHCLTHTSGLPDLLDFSTAFPRPMARTREEALKKLAAMPVVSQPGEKWAYIQTGYMLLGWITEKITGQSFEDFMAQRFFRPLGMSSTRFGDYKEIIPRRTSLYSRLEMTGDKISVSPDKLWAAYETAYLYPAYTHPGAGINTTVEDLAKWDAALSEGRILKQSSLEEMWTAVKLNDGKVAVDVDTGEGQGYGWVVDDRPGHKSVALDGGGATAYRRYLDEKLTVIVLTNCQGADPIPLVKEVAAFYIPNSQQPK